LTSKPFGVNLTILGAKRGEPEFPSEFAEVITKNKIRVVETCGGGIPLMKQVHALLRAGGVAVLISKCVQVKHALAAQNELGSDMVSLMGFDSGGLPGEADIGIFVQAALAKKQLRIPFLLSGGVANGSQLLAALALGAAGVQVGTRFNATVECSVWPDAFKARMLAAGPRDTVIIGKPFNASSRVLKNKDATAVLAIEKELGKDVKFQDVGKLIMFDRLRDGIAAQDADLGVWNCGQSVALIDDVPTCKALITRLIQEAEDALHLSVLPSFTASL
jgi:nitronate monooxygenase